MSKRTLYLVFIPFLKEGCGNAKQSSKRGATKNDSGPGKQALMM